LLSLFCGKRIARATSRLMASAEKWLRFFGWKPSFPGASWVCVTPFLLRVTVNFDS